MKYLLALTIILTSCTQAPQVSEPEQEIPGSESPTPRPQPFETMVAEIEEVGSSSKCAAYFWKDRGRSPKAYMKGMALVYARAVCNRGRPDVLAIAQPLTGNTVKDALSWYAPDMKERGIRMDSDLERLKAAYTLLIGLGMRESSGRHCCGRDMSADYSTADSAEAGLFQASYGSRRSSSELGHLFTIYRKDIRSCFLDTFRQGVSCKAGDAKNWGTGDGVEWQRLTKVCPAFSAEWAAVLIRHSGGTKGEFGPLRRKQAEVRIECHSMLSNVEKMVLDNPAVCGELE